MMFVTKDATGRTIITIPWWAIALGILVLVLAAQ